MDEQLQARLAALLSRPRVLPAQTQRQLDQQVAEHHSHLASFLAGASGLLEEYELDILFAPVFTPTIDERAELADMLFHWRPTEEQLRRMVPKLCEQLGQAVVILSDGAQAKLTLHEVMVERFVRLLRLDAGPEPQVSAALRDALPADLWNIGVALLCERGMTPAHQAWAAAFVNHARGHRVMTREFLSTTVVFLASQNDLAKPPLLAAAEALRRATESTAAFTASGHNYWSADVAQHHHYRGQGTIDRERLAARQAEAENVAAMVEELRTFEI